ncbi:unnamed protein product [Tilletia controversa]|uniref:Serine/threonine-protein kinase 32A n=1 Tax=Tilletia controversa TaxID=13291 RepID=A0A8X7SZ98_9BASI|nr:hypothetical protein CF328_g1705 [Tilletia controversa]KAE8252714.1 hypothetical protein A4X06_0g1980 [Tilletia controversa]CAD6919907.1 unnamed protein product [Tilletia controversa]CAD6948306.1 unnamed protein product [Tilletia controversa]CAD6982476.1 unnamed protein product [Tilletia controversa]
MGAMCCKPEVIDFEGEVDLYHFYLLRAVGKGAFGKVRVVQHKQTKNLYALKYINKAKCCKMRAVSNIIQERRLLEEIESPFICNLRYAFQDDENLFMVLDLMLGGDLRFHLDRSGNMKEEVVRFYVAELAIGLDYLHRLQIVHRDLKPDNVLLDEKGHAHITDFNIAVHFAPRRPLTSVAGSMAYMAPEVLAKRGYLHHVDWWSLGVMSYELLFGRRPFRGKTNSALTHSILNDRCVFPENVDSIVSPECIGCVKGMLERDVTKRLGCRNGLEDFKTHPWFAGLDWAAIEAKQITPPFEPDSKRANFDATHELEELLLEDNPLKARRRQQGRDPSTLAPDLRKMEEHFLPFDHLKQKRRSFFKRRADGDFGTASQASQASQASVAGTLADQPLADMNNNQSNQSIAMNQIGNSMTTGPGPRFRAV